jgi:hypothetical protein
MRSSFIASLPHKTANIAFVVGTIMAVTLQIPALSHTSVGDVLNSCTTIGCKAEARSVPSSTALLSAKKETIKAAGTGGLVQKIFKRFKPAPTNYLEDQKAQALRSDNKYGIYLSGTSMGRKEFLDEKIEDLLNAGGTSLIFDAKGGIVFFDSTSPLAEQWGVEKPYYDLPEVLAKLKEKGIYTMARFVAVKDENLINKHPEFSVKHPKTGRLMINGWIDPAHPDAVEYNKQVICDLAAAGIDEVNLDYIRFSTANFGELKVFSGKEKADKVEVFVKAAREAIDACGPKTKLGLSTYAILGWNYPVNLETLGQDVVRFAPLVDIISPMAYPATFTSPEYYVAGKNPGSRDYWLVYRTLTGYTDLLGEEHKHKIRPWIQGYSVTAKDVKDQIKAVYDAGYCGFQVWNAGNNYTQTFAAMKDMPERPERCKD